MAKARREEIESLRIKADLKNHIADLHTLSKDYTQDLFASEPFTDRRMPFG